LSQPASDSPRRRQFYLNGAVPSRAAVRSALLWIGAYSLAITNRVQATQLYQGAKHVEGLEDLFQ
jgi:hypothetical protein